MRRERMVVRLLQAVMECYTEHLQSGPPTVEEVIARADVSRATFYKYFNSVDEAIEKRASELVDEMIESLQNLVEPQMKPILLFTISVHLFLMRSVLDPTWGAFVARSNLVRPDGPLILGLNVHLHESRIAGEVKFPDERAARILAIGTMREAIRFIAESDQPQRTVVEEVMLMILVGFGLTREAAAALVSEATIFIRGAAPDRLSWWSDPWLGDRKP